MNITNFVLLFVYSMSMAICIVSIFEALKKISSDNPYAQSNGLIVALGGFAVFPVINTFFALFCIYWMSQDFKPFDFTAEK